MFRTTILLVFLIFTACGKKEPAVDVWTAAAAGNLAVIKAHIAVGTDINAVEPSVGSSPLIVAALFGQADAIQLLLANGADIDIQNNEGSTALHTAAFFCHTDSVTALLENGADTELLNDYGRTALESVAGAWSSEVESLYSMYIRSLQLPLDLERVKKARPEIAELIRSHNES